MGNTEIWAKNAGKGFPKSLVVNKVKKMTDYMIHVKELSFISFIEVVILYMRLNLLSD